VGPSQTVFATPTVLVNGVSLPGGPVALSLTVQELKTDSLPVLVNTKPTQGYQVVNEQTYAYCDNPSEPCKVTVSAPASYFNKLVAYVEISGDLTATSWDVPNVPVKFTQGGNPVDFASLNTFPKPGIEHSVMPHVKVTATRPLQSKPVTLRPKLAGQQACGYAIDGIVINPGAGVALVSGPADLVGKSPDVIDLAPIDITGAGGNVTRRLPVGLSDPKLQSDPSQVTVTVMLRQAFVCAAPTPPPPPPPTATPTPTPRPSP
jgi:hypothetical protein